MPGPDNRVEVGTNSFTGGLVTVLPPHLLQEGQAQDCNNIDFSSNYGAITPRAGSMFYVRPQTADPSTTGLYQFIKSDGTKKMYAVGGGDIYEVSSPSTMTSRYHQGGAIGFSNFTTASDLCIVVGPNIPTMKNTGAAGAFVNLLGTPPSNGNYIAFHRNRIFIANHGGGKSRVSYCALNADGSVNPEDWTTIVGAATDAGFIDVGKDDGDTITGILSLGSVMIIWKNNSTWLLAGSNPTNFVVRPISLLIGCVAPRSIVRADQFAIFLSNLGVYHVTANGNGVVLASYNIKPTLDALPYATKQIACAGRYLTQYWLCVDTNADGLNDTVYYLDYVLGAWGRYYTNNPFAPTTTYVFGINVFFTTIDGLLYGGRNDYTAVISFAQNGVFGYDEAYNGTTFQNFNTVATWMSKKYDFNAWANKKQIQDLIVFAKPSSGNSIELDVFINPGTTIFAKTMSLTQVGVEDPIVYKKGAHPISGTSQTYLPYMQFRFTSFLNPVVVLGYSMVADVLERENG